MESRNISLTLEKAKEWYNSGNEALKEAALQAFTEDELKTMRFSEIKSFEDAYEALGMSHFEVSEKLEYFYPSFPKDLCNHLAAIYKLDIILKALNGDWEPSLTKGIAYDPVLWIHPAGYGAARTAKERGWKVCQSFITEGREYSLISGHYLISHNGLSNFGTGYGMSSTALGLLSCKSSEIAIHMSTYFAKEIFEACYAHYVGTYE